jgi:hypothetical protein
MRMADAAADGDQDGARRPSGESFPVKLVAETNDHGT